MAGDWIKMRASLWTDPRVIRLARVTRVKRSSVTGALYRLWSLSDTHTTDGRLEGYTADDIDADVEIPGFAEALADPHVDWLELGDDFVQVRRFEDHMSKSAKRRASTAKRVSRHRKRNENVTPERYDGVTREEKRREDDDLSHMRDGNGRTNGTALPEESREGGGIPSPEGDPGDRWKAVEGLQLHPFSYGHLKARDIVERLGTTPADLEAWVEYGKREGTPAMMAGVRQWRNPREVPAPMPRAGGDDLGRLVEIARRAGKEDGDA